MIHATLLDIIFNEFKFFFDNSYILSLIYNYKNKIPICSLVLNQQIEKYKFSTKDYNPYII